MDEGREGPRLEQLPEDPGQGMWISRVVLLEPADPGGTRSPYQIVKVSEWLEGLQSAGGNGSDPVNAL